MTGTTGLSTPATPNTGTTTRVRTRRRSRWTTGRVLTHVVLLVAAAAVLLPYVYLITGSFKRSGDIFALPLRLWPSPATTANYHELFTTDLFPFLRQAGNSLAVGALTTVLVVAVSTMTGWGFARYEFPLRGPLFVVLLVTLTLPMQIAIVPLFDLMVSLRWLDTYQGLILPSGASAFGAFFMRQAMLSVPAELVQAARIDGASELRIFLTMGLPLVRGAVSVLAILSFLASWNDFLWPSIVLRSPDRQTYPVGLAGLVGLYQTEYGMILAGSFLVTVPIVILFVAGRRHILDNLTLGAVKS